MSSHERHRARTTGRTLGVRFSPLKGAPLLIAALALFLQTFLLPLHMAQPTDARAAALEQITHAVGNGVALCAAPDGSNSTHDGSDCRDDCPLCRFSSQTDLFEPAAPTVVAATLTAPRSLLPEAGASDPPQPHRAWLAQPRAPPFVA